MRWGDREESSFEAVTSGGRPTGKRGPREGAARQRLRQRSQPGEATKEAQPASRRTAGDGSGTKRDSIFRRMRHRLYRK